MKYKIGQKVKVVATNEQLTEIYVIPGPSHISSPYQDKDRIFIIIDIVPEKYFGRNKIRCPYQLDVQQAFFPEDYIHTLRLEKLERILKDEI